MIECKQVQYGKFPNSRVDNSDSSGPVRSIIKLIQDLIIKHILTMFGADWLIFVDDKSVNKVIFSNFFQIQGQITTNVRV